jgi:hypothetical protein
MRGTNNGGIGFITGGALHVQDTVIRKVTEGIRFAPTSGNPELYVGDTVITDAAASASVYVQPMGSAGARVLLERVRVERNSNFGILFQGGFTSGLIKGTVRNSVAAGAGIAALESGSGTITLMIDRSAAVNYVGGTGILASGAGTNIQIGDSTVTGNLLGLSATDGAAIQSYGNNKVDGNGSNGAPTSTINLK